MILTLDPTLLLSQQIALGKYDKTDSLIVAGRFCFHFQDAAQDIIDFEWKLFPYEGESLKREVEYKMGREGFVPADLEFGLAFGAQMPDEQRKADIALLGAHGYVAQGECMFVCLKGSATHRELGVTWDYSGEGDIIVSNVEDPGFLNKNPHFLGVKRLR